MELVFGDVAVGQYLQTDVVETFKRAYTGGTHGNGLGIMGKQPFDGAAAHTDVLAVHLVSLYAFALDRLEGTCSDVKRHLLALYATLVDGMKHIVGEVKACRGSCNAALDARVNGLVGGLVALLRLAIKIGRYGQFTHSFEHLGKRQGLELRGFSFRSGLFGIAPGQSDYLRSLGIASSCQHHVGSIGMDDALKRSLLPLLGIAYKTLPLARMACLEYLFIVGRLMGFQEKHLNKRPRRLAEMESGLDDAGVVVDHQCPFGQIGWKVVEHIVADLTMPIDKQLGVVALANGEFRNSLIGQRIVIIADLYVFRIHRMSFIS